MKKSHFFWNPDSFVGPFSKVNEKPFLLSFADDTS